MRPHGVPRVPLAVWGRLRRTGVGGVSIVADEVWDLVTLAAARREGRLLDAMEGEAPPEAPRWKSRPEGASGYPRPGGTGGEDRKEPRKLWHASGGSAGW